MEKENLKDIGKVFLEDIIIGGLVVFMAAIFYFGAMPTYFGVNNEFINPTNESLGINKSIDMVSDVGKQVMLKMMKVGEEHATLFFWLWWAIIIIYVIYPIIKVIHKIIKFKCRSSERGFEEEE